MQEIIENGQGIVGIEFGSTRIKSVLIDNSFNVLATGVYDWKSEFIDGIWSYNLNEIRVGIKNSYRALLGNVKTLYGVGITRLSAIGISGMMHGYLALDADGNILVPFRTWRNTITKDAADILTDKFKYNIPQRWSIAHLYQAILNNEPHVKNVRHITTLAGYVHYLLTGKMTMGVGEASGMFPIDQSTGKFDKWMLTQFDELVADKGYEWHIWELLPEIMVAGKTAGILTSEGACLLDETGMLQPGTLLCPPEGDAGTGMVATNSVGMNTGNVSAGTSIFSMIVLKKQLSQVYREIDMVMTPDGNPVAMVHCNNCTEDLNVWMALFSEFAEMFGLSVKTRELYDRMFKKALEGDGDCDGVVAFNFYSGEDILKVKGGIPLLIRKPESRFSLANFMRAQLYSSIAALKIGMDILVENEHVVIHNLMGHGGFFKTKMVGQRILASALNIPVTVMETASEGGAFGIAVLAKYAEDATDEPLELYLKNHVYNNKKMTTFKPVMKDIHDYTKYIERFRKDIAIENMAIDIHR